MKRYVVRRMDREVEGMMFEIVESENRFDALAYVFTRPLAKRIVAMMNDPLSDGEWVPCTLDEVSRLGKSEAAFFRRVKKEPKP